MRMGFRDVSKGGSCTIRNKQKATGNDCMSTITNNSIQDMDREHRGLALVSDA